jgi:hypothetical protein
MVGQAGQNFGEGATYVAPLISYACARSTLPDLNAALVHVGCWLLVRIRTRTHQVYIA